MQYQMLYQPQKALSTLILYLIALVDFYELQKCPIFFAALLSLQMKQPLRNNP